MFHAISFKLLHDFSAIHEEREVGLDKSKFIRVWEVRQTFSLCPTGLGIMTGLLA
jgi:hypothetical protein